jgi:hypothetical protein
MDEKKQLLPAVCGLIIEFFVFPQTIPEQQITMIKFNQPLTEAEISSFTDYLHEVLGREVEITISNQNIVNKNHFLTLLIQGHEAKKLCDLAKIHTRR